jgi:hypothetical protein
MKKYLVLAGVLSLIFVFYACDSTDSNEQTAKTCELGIGPIEVPLPIQVKYKVEKTGDGVISRITYMDNTGLTVIENPTLPWEKTITLADTNSFSMSAAGTRTNGSHQIKYEAEKSGVTYSASDKCEQYIN